MAELPRGTVTFLATDVEGSTARWERDAAAMGPAVQRHFALLRTAVDAAGGTVFKTIGDAVLAAFPTALAAAIAALDAQRALRAETWPAAVGPLRARMALHTGEAAPDGDDYPITPTLNRLARLLSAGHGEQILLSAPTFELMRDALPNWATVHDLGEHRLKDLYRPERVFQLVAPDLPETFPPLRTLEGRQSNLPAQPTPLVGREREVAEVVALLRRDEVRLVTLTGPGGIGKTRLQLQVGATLLDDYPDGVWFVDLAPVRDPAVVPSAIAAVLGVREEGGRPLAETLRTALADKRLLLLLDNVEQVIAAAPVVGEVLTGAPGVRVLATSRSPLQLRAEHQYPVPPLSLPDRQRRPSLDRLTQYEAVRLFVERAVTANPAFAVTNATVPAVAEICHELDGLPLAIELAAARTRLLSPDALLRRLEHRLTLLTGGARDLPARHRTLRATIAWSDELLAADERALFRRLAVFAGGASFEAAEAVTNPDGALDLLAGLTALVDQSLLRQTETAAGESRFGMLETIREYAEETLDAAGEGEATRREHAAFFLALAEESAPALTGPEQAAWLGRLATEHDNLRAALRWTLAHDAEAALRLAGALWRFWYVRGHFAEGRRWLDAALAQSGPFPAAVRATALHGAGVLADEQGDVSRAVALLEESLTLRRDLGDRAGTAALLNSLGAVAHEQGDFVQAALLYEESLRLRRDLGDRWGIAFALHNLGDLAHDQGDDERAAVLLGESLALAREVGDTSGVAFALHNLGEVAYARKDYGQAATLFHESLALERELGDQDSIAFGLESVAHLAAAQQQPAAAARLAGAAAALRTALGVPLPPAARVTHDPVVEATRAALGEAAFAAAWQTGYGYVLDDAVAEALALADVIASSPGDR